MKFAVLAGIYTGGACIAAGIRSKDDALNYGVGGACVGAFLGVRTKSIHKTVMNIILLGATGTAIAYATKITKNSEFNSKEQFYRNYAYMPQPEDKE